MKKIIELLCCLLLLHCIPVVMFAGDIIELKTVNTQGGNIQACEKIRLLPGFSFKAASDNSMHLNLSLDVCDPMLYQTSISDGQNNTTNQNYIVTVTPLDETGAVEINGSKISVGREYSYKPRFNTTIQYYDGLGRPSQMIQYGFTPLERDLITLQEYDEFGRESKTWLPMPSSISKLGSYRNISDIKSGISSKYGGDQNPYSLLEYEASPLNRIVAQYGPGADWHKNYDAQSKAVRTDYLTNNSSNPCLLFKITSTGITKKGNYDAGSFYVTKITDEDGKASLEFKNKQGQVVLTRQLGTTQSQDCDTYYIYDDLGNLRYVLPPILVDRFKYSTSMAIDALDMKNYAYVYKYDERNLCIEKRLPGCDWIYYVYDKGDRLIFMQDGEMRKDVSKKMWAFTKYDALGRLILSGTAIINKEHQTLISEYKESHIVESKSGETYGYTWNTMPDVKHTSVLQVNYYDKHEDFLAQFGEPYKSTLDYSPKSGYDTRYVDSSQGLLVGTRTFVLDEVPKVEIITAMYYDERGRVIQTRTKNYLGKLDCEYTAYDFSGRPTKRFVEHELKSSMFVTENGSSKTVSTLSEDYTYTYDHAGRLKETKRNGIVIAKNEYNELGQLINKQQGGVLNSSYAYNIRGAMKSINETKTGLSQVLKYNEGGLYNGNIAGLKTSYNNKPDSLDFIYTYDYLNRLRDATSAPSGGKRNSEYLQYDKHGNVLMVTRDQDGKFSEWINFEYNGNQLSEALNDPFILDPKLVQYPSDWSYFSYNQNGSLTKDTGRGIVTIQYNYLNLPKLIQFSNGNQTHYSYSADGQKLRTKHIVAKQPIGQPIVVIEGSTRSLRSDEIASTLITDYVDNFVYEDLIDGAYGTYKPDLKVYHEEGYDSYQSEKTIGQTHSKEEFYYLKDYIGNNRDVVSSKGTNAQRTEYYPFGTPMAQKVGNAGEQPYKYSGKEFDTMHGLNFYDFHARQYDPLLARFTSIDPLAEKYYHLSPYVYCANNPLRFIDPDGRQTTLPISEEFARQAYVQQQINNKIQEKLLDLPKPVAVSKVTSRSVSAGLGGEITTSLTGITQGENRGEFHAYDTGAITFGNELSAQYKEGVSLTFSDNPKEFKGTSMKGEADVKSVGVAGPLVGLEVTLSQSVDEQGNNITNIGVNGTFGVGSSVGSPVSGQIGKSYTTENPVSVMVHKIWNKIKSSFD